MCSNYESPQNEVNDLIKTLKKFTSGKKSLEALIRNQRKEGLRYIPRITKNIYKNPFVRKTIGN